MPLFQAVYAAHALSAIITPKGEMLVCDHAAAAMRLGAIPTLVCHAPLTLQYMGRAGFVPLDVLELYAFTYPGKFLVPSVVGLAQALDLTVPDEMADYPATLQEAASRILDDLTKLDQGTRHILHDLAEYMGQGGKGWTWAPHVIAALNVPPRDASVPAQRDIFTRLFARLPETEDPGPMGSHSHHPVRDDDVLARLNLMLHNGAGREDRADQRAYATTLARAFQSPEQEDAPNIVVAEAGTGIGKTLGYLSPATVWAEQNEASVWISTYTKNLQKQLDQELYRLPLVDADRERYAVTRKGRENYLCLLNFAEYAAAAHLRPTPVAAIAAGLMMRWVMGTRDGDFTGVDYPGWLTSLLGSANTIMMADRRGECIHAGCEFYNRCFIERSVRKARQARIVVANHTLVMIEAARADADDRLPGYLVFDEGHHLLDAADSVFSTSISVQDGYDLRRWLIGAEGGRKSRLKGIKRRLEDIATDDAGRALLDHIVHAARCLPSEAALDHLRDGQAVGSMEAVLQMVAAQVNARADATDKNYSIETPVSPMVDGLSDALRTLKTDLQRLQTPMHDLIAYFNRKLGDEAADLNTDQRNRLQSVVMGLERRANQMIAAWISLLHDLISGVENPDFVDWMEITRIEGRVFDVGIFRHWRNPMQPFGAMMKDHLYGGVITSATLRDRTTDDGWAYARAATGVDLISSNSHLHAFKSPFDYVANTRVLVITDVSKNNMDDMAGAYRALFTAAGGGALGLFTAIQRLRGVHKAIVKPLEQSGLRLYAQHVDKMDNGTLVDLFRADRHACLLGTDAMRDGVDVPGDSLRLLIYDRVPWPQARLLHKARRELFGGRVYDEQLARLRLKQAYGRLVRRADDRGIFVMMDSALPTRLCDAFPDGVSIERVGLQQAVGIVQEFLNTAPAAGAIRQGLR